MSLTTLNAILASFAAALGAVTAAPVATAALATLAATVAHPAHGQTCAAGAEAVGPVTRVRDGDTLVVAGVAIRLHGVAAPERGTGLGESATRFIDDRVRGATLRCVLDGSRTGDRCGGICYLTGGDLGAALVRAGFGRDCPRFSGGRYAEAERAARQNRLDLAARYKLPSYCRPR